MVTFFAAAGRNHTFHIETLLHKQHTIARLPKVALQPVLVMRSASFVPPFDLLIWEEYLHQKRQ
jgi:hypothetical protein